MRETDNNIIPSFTDPV